MTQQPQFGKEACKCKGPEAEVKDKVRKGCRADSWVGVGEIGGDET